MCASVGVMCNLYIPYELGKILIAILLVFFFMYVFDAIYPPAGAICIIPTLGISKIELLGYHYVWSPVFTGICIINFYSFIYKQLVLWQVKKQLKQ